MKEQTRKVIALAGQPNSGKSTIFNSLTGSRQHVANYPGVTVDIKTGYFSSGGTKVAVADLPGTYSLTSYSQEERVARDFLLHEKPDLVVNVVDASNLKRNLYFTFQLLEMGVPLLIDLNMADVAKNRGIEIDIPELSRILDLEIFPTVGNKRTGQDALKNALVPALEKAARSKFTIDYGPMEEPIRHLSDQLASQAPEDFGYPVRWLAVKLFENDTEAEKVLEDHFEKHEEIREQVRKAQEAFEAAQDEPAETYLAFTRHILAEKIEKKCVKKRKEASATLTDKIDKVVCNRYAGFVVLAAVIFLLYDLSIRRGYEVTYYLMPYLDRLQSAVDGILPVSGFLHDPLIRSVVMSVVQGLNAILIYIPIFLILFALVAVLEDVGYMPRMAFILDRLFRKFGLHGHSTLPLILGGVFVGGCAVPGVMATRVIADQKARLATILIVPLMNCMAKIPLYVLLISIFFVEQSALVMFFISSITIIIALPVAKILTMTVLKNQATAPFVMELPPYHLPTIRGVVTRSVERTWLFFKKVMTVIMLVSVGVFFLTSYPGLESERVNFYESQAEEVKKDFFSEIDGTKFYPLLSSENALENLFAYEESFKTGRRVLGGATPEQRKAFLEDFESKNPELFPLLRARNPEEKLVSKAFGDLKQGRSALRRQMNEEVLKQSFLGRAGRFLTPVTQFAGFDWKVNIALLSSLAAKESSVATLGSIYQASDADGTQSLDERIKEQEKGFSPLHALALMVFMALYPPCIPTLLMIRVEAGSWKWALLSLIYPIVLGLAFASLIFTGGSMLGLSGIQAMAAFYILALAVALLFGTLGVKQREITPSGKEVTES